MAKEEIKEKKKQDFETLVSCLLGDSLPSYPLPPVHWVIHD
jgi:hypothetical protein